MSTNRPIFILLILLLLSAIVIAGCVNISETSPEAATSTAIMATLAPGIVEATLTLEQVDPATEETNPTMNTADADVKYVKAIQTTNGTWTFHVTVYHPDTGWEDYVNGWDVVTLDGIVIKPDQSSIFTRLLLHPHVGEQPFTRSQAGIVIPDGVAKVIVRANDLLHGFGGEEITVDLTQISGDNYEVQATN
ncbi:MAG: hypothetical protein N2C13_00315 [Chloroflexota bacterium]